jgi:hypothetical protein
MILTIRIRRLDGIPIWRSGARTPIADVRLGLIATADRGHHCS